METKRVQWLDIAKGITILLMVLGHTSIPMKFSNFIFSFHMPLFFIASGWCSNWTKKSFGRYILAKTHSLLVPFWVYSFIVLLIAHFSLGNNNEITFANLITKGWLGYPLWFVPVLFFALLIAKAIFFYVKRKLVGYSIFCALAVIGALLSYNRIYLPWAVSTIPYATVLIGLGYSLKKYGSSFEHAKWWFFVICLAITIIISQIWRMDMAWNSITPLVPKTIGAVSGTVMIFVLSVFIEKKSVWISKVLQLIGKETYVIMALALILCYAIDAIFPCNKIIEYVIVFLCLVWFALLKNMINKLIGHKIL